MKAVGSLGVFIGEETEADCGCRLTHRAQGGHMAVFHYCPLHLAAPDFLAAVERVWKIAARAQRGGTGSAILQIEAEIRTLLDRQAVAPR